MSLVVFNNGPCLPFDGLTLEKGPNMVNRQAWDKLLNTRAVEACLASGLLSVEESKSKKASSDTPSDDDSKAEEVTKGDLLVLSEFNAKEAIELVSGLEEWQAKACLESEERKTVVAALEARLESLSNEELSKDSEETKEEG